MKNWDGSENTDWFGTFMMIVVIAAMGFLVFIWLIYPLIVEDDLNDFCESQDYDKGTYGQTKWEKSYCIQYEGHKVIKDPVEHCLDSWCFIESSQSSKEEKP